MDELVYWIWLSLCSRPDSATFPSLLKKFSCAKEVFDATDREISSALSPRSSDRNLLLERDLTKAVEIYEFCKSRGVGIITYGDSKYPDSLRNIKTPPVLLYYRGVLPDLNSGVRIAIVGTRRLSDYGRKNAFSLAYDIAKSGATVVSGMAIGIDGVALAAALAAEAPTIAVIGSGIDVCYPPEHLTLARNIVRNGCIFTEYPPGFQPTRFSFPQRNRIISALSDATVVIEGRERSGAMITARYALEQGRLLYALPASIDSPNSEASLQLLKNGARAVSRAEDIIADFSDARRGGVLNPFVLSERLPVNMTDTLRGYGVSCTAPTDINPTARSVRLAKRNTERKENKKTEEKAPDEPIIDNDGEVARAYSDEVLNIYKKIPTSGECALESLADGQISLRAVMRAMLKLEIGGFVTLLPGERVKRKTK